eukprot:339648-Pyramimonas_sp.AAC.1
MSVPRDNFSVGRYPNYTSSVESTTPWSSRQSTPHREGGVYAPPPYVPNVSAGYPQPRPVVKGLFGGTSPLGTSIRPVAGPAPWYPPPAGGIPSSRSSVATSSGHSYANTPSTVRTPVANMTASGVPGPSLRPPPAPSSVSRTASQSSLEGVWWSADNLIALVAC